MSLDSKYRKTKKKPVFTTVHVPVEVPEKLYLPTVAEWERREFVVLDRILKQTEGTIVEFGCYEGRLTRFLAVNNPQREFIAIDWDGKLRPNANGRSARFLDFGGGVPNVTSQCANSAHFRLDPWPVGLVIVAGNWTYEQVAADTHNILSYRALLNPDLVVVWRDYFEEGAGEPQGVGRYLRDLSHRLPLTHIAGTSLVVLNLKSND